MPIMRVIMWSGGRQSWYAARRVADAYGTDGMVLLFADTLAEDSDLYRFNVDAARDIGLPITRVCDGRTPQTVGYDVRHLGNTQIANCSHLLKQAPARAWMEANADADAVVYVGIDWMELHRLPSIEHKWMPWTVEAPLTEPPYVDKEWIDAELVRRGVNPPRLYGMGFSHNNCGGACVKAGQAQWALLLDRKPELYASWEAHENTMRRWLDKDIAILRDRRDGTTKALPLTVLRQRIQGQDPAPYDPQDIGGCGCFTSDDT